MAFHEVRFPTDISYGSKGGPTFNTSVIVLGSGHEQRNINWSDARCEFDVAYGVTTGSQLTSLIEFFRARFGRAHAFRYKDWSDFSGVLQVATLLTSTTYQIYKTYTSGGQVYNRKITKLVSGTVTVYKAGVLQSTGYTVNYNTGVITFSVSPGSDTITVTFEFDVPVRFDTDKLSTSLDNYNSAGTYFGGASVPLVEVRV